MEKLIKRLFDEGVEMSVYPDEFTRTIKVRFYKGKQAMALCREFDFFDQLKVDDYDFLNLALDEFLRQLKPEEELTNFERYFGAIERPLKLEVPDENV